MAKYSIGIYIRLSLADIDLSKREGKTESESITNQRALINRYLDKHEEFEECPREEFFDDGYSGTNFARPSFEKMMEKVKKGKINPTEMVGPCLYGVLSCNTAPERSSVGFIRKYFVTSKLFKQSMATRFVCLPVLT